MMSLIFTPHARTHNQYKNPNNQSGILLPKPTFISSAATKELGMSFICLNDLFFKRHVKTI
ncbi:MAG: hypothetical protein QG558_1629 [Campylobacterota bacterium]|nr:hypothetical protein [Campylobacterota bacterium]MDQ1338020.1 hypothetical protein [Campylobacterota bacterium]